MGHAPRRLVSSRLRPELGAVAGNEAEDDGGTRAREPQHQGSQQYRTEKEERQS